MLQLLHRLLIVCLIFSCSLAYAGTVEVRDDGVSQGYGAAALDFTGAGVTTTKSGIVATINIPGGGGGTGSTNWGFKTDEANINTLTPLTNRMVTMTTVSAKTVTMHTVIGENGLLNIDGNVSATNVSARTVKVDTQFLAPNGSNAVPSYAFFNDPDTGFQYETTPSVELIVGGNIAATYQYLSLRFAGQEMQFTRSALGVIDIYVYKTVGGMTKLASWDADGQEFNYAINNFKTTWGTSGNASITYTGSNMYINPQEVGSGDLAITGKTTKFGVGTTGPLRKMDVGSDSDSDIFRVWSDNATYTSFDVVADTDAGTPRALITFREHATPRTNLGTQKAVMGWYNPWNAWTVGGSSSANGYLNVITQGTDAGNVGIGDSSPDAKLDVAGGISATSVSATTIMNDVGILPTYDTVQFTITEPDQVDASSKLVIWSNEQPRDFVIDKITGWSDTTYNFILKKHFDDGTDGTYICDFGANTANGDLFKDSIESLSGTTVTSDTAIYIDLTAGAPNHIKMSIKGHYE